MEETSELIRSCVRGDREAMELLYNTYSRRMMRVIRRYVPDSKAAEDILHDGFIVIFTRIGDVRESDRLEYWMASIMKNLCLGYLSQLDLTTILNEDIALPDLPELDDLLGYDELMTLINRLPDGYRNVFKLAVLDGKSHREIGKILGIEPHSSSSQLYHAKVLLRRMIMDRKRELGLLGLLLPLFIAGWFFMGRHTSSGSSDDGRVLTIVAAPEEKPTASTSLISEAGGSHDTSPINTPTVKSAPFVQEAIDTIPQLMAEKVAAKEDPCPEQIAETIIKEVDSMLIDLPAPPSPQNDVAEYRIISAAADDEWSISPGISLDPSRLSVSGGIGDNIFSDSPEPVHPGNPGAPYPPIRPVSPNPIRVYEMEADHELPLTLGVNVARRLSERLSVETGVSAILLRTSLHYTAYRVDAVRKARTFYLGIPLKLNLRFFRTRSFSLYATAGGEVAFPLSLSSKTYSASGASDVLGLPDLTVRPQLSLLGGLGLQYNFKPNLGIYAEPSVRYNFSSHSTLPTYWQEHPTMFTLPVGLRITW